jgi:amino acid transporter
MITFYGLGTIVGGGFYALVGKVSAEAGMFTPIAFLMASVIAMFSAFSYAELSARYPFSAGEAHYVMVAFRRIWPAAVVGWAVILTGVVSAATLADAFAGFVRTLIDVPHGLLICLMVLSLSLVAIWGIGESAVLALVITVIELGGLLVIVIVAGDRLGTIPQRWAELTPGFSFQTWSGILIGGYLAFYSFVGFEDMVNVAEEVKDPVRNLPIAILASLGLTTLLYSIVTLVAVLAIDQRELVASDSPLSLVFERGSRAAAVITGIGMLSGLNGALVQIVMASRVAYGMAVRHVAPSVFTKIDPRTRTPIVATCAVAAVVLVLALGLPIVVLAKVTSTILLVVYALVNLALVVIKIRDREPPAVGPSYPIWLPITGVVACAGFVSFHLISLL